MYQISDAKRILDGKRLFIFDMDGTIYLGSTVYDFAVRFIHHLRASGRKILFFTNNASHSPVFYMDRLNRMGFDPQDDELLTSGHVTIGFLKRHRPGKAVYLVGTPELESQFTQAGIELSDKADIVVTSFDTTLTYAKLDTACRLIRNGAEYLSTHPDFNCPVEGGFIPDSGAIAAFVTASTKVKPTYFGKPYPETLQMICEFTGIGKEEMCLFGDRLYTDIALGKRNGVTASLVLSGETTIQDVEQADEADKPDFCFGSLADVDALMFPAERTEK